MSDHFHLVLLKRYIEKLLNINFLILLIENTPFKSTHPLDSKEERKEQQLDAQ